jgi:hypothetical protein
MSKNKLVAMFFVLFFAFCLFSTTAFGGILDFGTPYTDVSNVTWAGTVHYIHVPAPGHTFSGLEGDIDWIVYGPGQFPYGDSGYNPPSDLYTYVYQFNNSGTAALSDFQFSVDQEVGNIDSFVLPGKVEGVLASSTDYLSGEGGYVDWAFNINGGGASAGLVFTSPKAPTVTSTGVVTDSGTSALVTSLPCPGPNDVPEPNTIILLMAGCGLVAIMRRFSRR